MEKTKEKLEIIDPTAVKEELSSSDEGTEDPELKAQAEQLITTLLSSEVMENSATREKGKATLENLGADLQKKAGLTSGKLKDPIKKISQRGEDGGEVGNALIDLRMQVEALDPAKFNFEAGWFSRIVGYLPGVGSPLKRYFSKYESAQTILDAIIKSLEQGREQLKRDNITLSQDQNTLRDLTIRIQKAIKLAQIIDQDLQSKLDYEVTQDDPKYSYIQEELQFPLRQRIMDLQQQLAVNQQSVLALEVVIRNNKELIRGVNRAINVTVNALSVAVTVALALVDQKIVLEKVQSLNTTTSDLIKNTAERLKVQGTEIHKMASSTQLNMESLKLAFADINEAMQDISEYRKSSLPQMAETIVELDKLTKGAEEKIASLEQGNKAESLMPIEF